MLSLATRTVEGGSDSRGNPCSEVAFLPTIARVPDISCAAAAFERQCDSHKRHHLLQLHSYREAAHRS